MAALTPLSPTILKAVLERVGYTLHKESTRNWIMVRGESTILLPKRGDIATFAVQNYVLDEAKLDLPTLFSIKESLKS